MMKETAALPLEQAKAYIDTIDFLPIINKLERQHGWCHYEAASISDMYRNFLYLQKKYGKTHALPPSEEIDEFWHMHILDTKKYRHDCEIIFGYYLDHYPYFGIDDKTSLTDLETAFATMQQLYQHEFGTPIYEIRTWLSKLTSVIKQPFSRYKPKRVEG